MFPGRLVFVAVRGSYPFLNLRVAPQSSQSLSFHPAPPRWSHRRIYTRPGCAACNLHALPRVWSNSGWAGTTYPSLRAPFACPLTEWQGISIPETRVPVPVPEGGFFKAGVMLNDGPERLETARHGSEHHRQSP